MSANGSEARHGICPFITMQAPVQTNIRGGGNGSIVPLHSEPQIGALTFKAPCLGSECQLWFEASEKSGCSLKRVNTEVALLSGVAANVVEAIGRLAHAWESLAGSRHE